MAKRRSIYERLAIKQKLEMARKGHAMRTLREELERTTNIQKQLSAIVDDTAIKPGTTTVMHIRSASWYSTRVHEQLTTISNRNDFLSAEVSAQEKQLVAERYGYELSVNKGIEHRRREREEREERLAALLPSRPASAPD